jgi:hypothetical protein
MDTAENLILKLNDLLAGERFYLKRLRKLLNGFIELENPKIILIDFEYYNSENLKLFYDKKLEFISVRDFEAAARYRTLEQECQEYLDIKEVYGIKKSMFFFEKEFLFYFYFGTNKHDKKIREFIMRFINK